MSIYVIDVDVQIVKMLILLGEKISTLGRVTSQPYHKTIALLEIKRYADNMGLVRLGGLNA